MAHGFPPQIEISILVLGLTENIHPKQSEFNAELFAAPAARRQFSCSPHVTKMPAPRRDARLVRFFVRQPDSVAYQEIRTGPSTQA
jgi:hypothetical protein